MALCSSFLSVSCKLGFSCFTSICCSDLEGSGKVLHLPVFYIKPSVVQLQKSNSHKQRSETSSHTVQLASLYDLMFRDHLQPQGTERDAYSVHSYHQLQRLNICNPIPLQLYIPVLPSKITAKNKYDCCCTCLKLPQPKHCQSLRKLSVKLKCIILFTTIYIK